MSNLLGNTAMPVYVKICATAILALTYLAALGVAVNVYLTQGANAQLPSVDVFILGTGLTLAINAIGLHQGASLLESPSPTQQQPAQSSDTSQGA